MRELDGPAVRSHDTDTGATQLATTCRQLVWQVGMMFWWWMELVKVISDAAVWPMKVLPILLPAQGAERAQTLRRELCGPGRIRWRHRTAYEQPPGRSAKSPDEMELMLTHIEVQSHGGGGSVIDQSGMMAPPSTVPIWRPYREI